MFGLWVFQIIAQSHDRASLISELGQTRAELARATRAMELGMLPSPGRP